jgi:polyphosphate glucokinase
MHLNTQLVHFDRLYIGGGNARLLDAPRAADVELVSNEAGILGGIALWQDARVPDHERP